VEALFAESDLTSLGGSLAILSREEKNREKDFAFAVCA